MSDSQTDWDDRGGGGPPLQPSQGNTVDCTHLDKCVPPPEKVSNVPCPGTESNSKPNHAEGCSPSSPRKRGRPTSKSQENSAQVHIIQSASDQTPRRAVSSAIASLPIQHDVPVDCIRGVSYCPNRRKATMKKRSRALCNPDLIRQAARLAEVDNIVSGFYAETDAAKIVWQPFEWTVHSPANAVSNAFVLSVNPLGFENCSEASHLLF